MRKSIIEPLDRPFARAVVVEKADHKRVFVSGAAAFDEEGNLVGEDDLERQTEYTLQQIESVLVALNGSMHDLVRIRGYLNVDLDDENYAALNDGRRDFFADVDHLPASTVIEIEGLVDDRLLVEVDAEAIIPDDEWDTEVVSLKELRERGLQ